MGHYRALGVLYKLVMVVAVMAAIVSMWEDHWLTALGLLGWALFAKDVAGWCAEKACGTRPDPSHPSG